MSIGVIALNLAIFIVVVTALGTIATMAFDRIKDQNELTWKQSFMGNLMLWSIATSIIYAALFLFKVIA